MCHSKPICHGLHTSQRFINGKQPCADPFPSQRKHSHGIRHCRREEKPYEVMQRRSWARVLQSPILAPSESRQRLPQNSAAFRPARQTEVDLSSYKRSLRASSSLPSQSGHPKALPKANILWLDPFVNAPSASQLRRPPCSSGDS